MELRTERLLLRAWRRDDIAALVRHANRREIWLNTGGLPFPYEVAHAEAFLAYIAANPLETHLAIVRDDEPVGAVGIYRRKGLEQCTGELGYWVGPSCWGRGYATEAARALVEHAFATTELARIEALVFTRNPASCRVVEKAGFTREGLKRKAAFKGGELLDEFLYARLRGE